MQSTRVRRPRHRLLVAVALAAAAGTLTAIAVAVVLVASNDEEDLAARVVLEEIRDRFPDYEIDEAGLQRTYQAHVRGFKVVPIAT